MPRVYKERMKLSWPAFAPTQDRGTFDDLAPQEPPKYCTRYLIKKDEGRPMSTKEKPWVPTGSHSLPSSARHYIFGSTCGALTLTCAYVVLSPGTSSVQGVGGAHWHTCEEAFYIARGRGWFEVDGERFNVEQGDWVFVPMRAIHCHMNTGNEPLELVAMRGVRLRGYDGPTETPIDYREFDAEGEP